MRKWNVPCRTFVTLVNWGDRLVWHDFLCVFPLSRYKHIARITIHWRAFFCPYHFH
jgi:hypothetical protein